MKSRWCLLLLLLTVPAVWGCQEKIAISIDTSGSIVDSDAHNPEEIKDNLKQAIDRYLFSPGARRDVCASIYAFNTKARRMTPLLSIREEENRKFLLDAIDMLDFNAGYPHYFTNWEAAIMAVTEEDYIYLITDGDPTTYEKDINPPSNDVQLNVDRAKKAKEMFLQIPGRKVVAIGVGPGVHDENLAAVTGPCRWSRCLRNWDYYHISLFSRLEETMDQSLGTHGLLPEIGQREVHIENYQFTPKAVVNPDGVIVEFNQAFKQKVFSHAAVHTDYSGELLRYEDAFSKAIESGLTQTIHLEGGNSLVIEPLVEPRDVDQQSGRKRTTTNEDDTDVVVSGATLTYHLFLPKATGLCLDDLYGGENGTSCSASDVQVIDTFIEVGGITCEEGEMLNMVVCANITTVIESTANERYDVGIVIATDGGDAVTGECDTHALQPVSADNTDLDFDSGFGPFYNGDGDSCGDVRKTDPNSVYVVSNLTFVCQDTTGDGIADLTVCTSWSNQGANDCTGPLDTGPQTPAKCNCAVHNVRGINITYPTTTTAEPTTTTTADSVTTTTEEPTTTTTTNGDLTTTSTTTTTPIVTTTTEEHTTTTSDLTTTEEPTTTTTGLTNGIPCNGIAYSVRFSPGHLYTIDFTDDPFNFTRINEIPFTLNIPPGLDPFNPGGGLVDIEVNNIGYRITDGFIYGVALKLFAPSASSMAGNYGMVKIDSSGTVFPVALPIPTVPTIGNYIYRFNAGDITPDGSTFYINSQVTSNAIPGVSNTLFVVDMIALDLDPTDATAVTKVTKSNFGTTATVADWAVHPVNGKLYGAAPTPSPARIWELDPITGTMVIIPGSGAIGLPSGTGTLDAYGGAWFNSNGTLFLHRNIGTVYAVELTGGPAIGGCVADCPYIVNDFIMGPSSTYNDAAACVGTITTSTTTTSTEEPTTTSTTTTDSVTTTTEEPTTTTTTNGDLTTTTTSDLTTTEEPTTTTSTTTELPTTTTTTTTPIVTTTTEEPTTTTTTDVDVTTTSTTTTTTTTIPIDTTTTEEPTTSTTEVPTTTTAELTTTTPVPTTTTLPPDGEVNKTNIAIAVGVLGALLGLILLLLLCCAPIPVYVTTTTTHHDDYYPVPSNVSSRVVETRKLK